MDITEFMTWFVNQVVTIFTKSFEILNSIEFAGTSLLKVIITITILVPLLGVVLTISANENVVGETSKRIKEKRKYEPKHSSEYKPKHGK